MASKGVNMNYLQIIITILSLLAAIFAWIAKIKWCNEYKEAKESQIELLKEKVEFFKDLSPMKLTKASNDCSDFCSPGINLDTPPAANVPTALPVSIGCRTAW